MHRNFCGLMNQHLLRKKPMLRKTIALCLLCVTLQAQSATTYTIDPENSSVSAYLPVWRNQGPVPGVTSPQSYFWAVEWQPTPYAISGTFETAENPDGSRWFGNVNITSLIPPSAGFGPFPGVTALGYLWSAFSLAGPCRGPSDYGCNYVGVDATDFATLSGNAIDLGRVWSVSNWDLGPIITPWTEGPTIPPEDISLVAGMYTYSIHATIIPEPGTCLLLISGLGLVALSTRRRKTKSFNAQSIRAPSHM